MVWAAYQDLLPGTPTYILPLPGAQAPRKQLAPWAHLTEGSMAPRALLSLRPAASWASGGPQGPGGHSAAEEVLNSLTTTFWGPSL